MKKVFHNCLIINVLLYINAIEGVAWSQKNKKKPTHIIIKYPQYCNKSEGLYDFRLNFLYNIPAMNASSVLNVVIEGPIRALVPLDTPA